MRKAAFERMHSNFISISIVNIEIEIEIISFSFHFISLHFFDKKFGHCHTFEFQRIFFLIEKRSKIEICSSVFWFGFVFMFFTLSSVRMTTKPNFIFFLIKIPRFQHHFSQKIAFEI